MGADQSKMVNITINGKALSVPSGTTVIQASLDAGFFIPHYCYHQDLSIAGVCRMCMVEVEKMPRLQISCNTLVAEGMAIRTDTQKVKDAVKNALELHLINHPIDCPICDKAGECKLQDYYAEFGLYQSRMELTAKVHKPKVQDIGTIVLDSERCILCSRCVRFTAEVTKTHELGIFNRGDRSELRTYDGGKLRNDYTGNLADICPVGALTAKDFRFQCRVWFLEKTPSVCTQCSRGCNTVVSVKPNTQELYRVEPRRNPHVNSSWICDAGRWDYRFAESGTRVRTPRRQLNGSWVDESWHAFFAAWQAEAQPVAASVMVGLSTQLTNEEIADAVGTFSELGVGTFVRVADDKFVGEKEPFDKILRHRDLTPNAAGFAKVMSTLGKKFLTVGEATKQLSAGGTKILLLVGLEGEKEPGWSELIGAVPSHTKIWAHATNRTALLDRCEWLLPNTSGFEKSGTMINVLGRAQRLNAAIPPQHLSRDAHSMVFGIRNGGDRQALPQTRYREVYEATTSKILFGQSAPKWFGFKQEGAVVEASV